MTKTLTEAECHALTVRGDVPGVLAPGILVEMDWCESDGETEETRRVSGVVVANLPNEHGDARVLWYSMDPRIGTDNRAAMFLRVPVVGNEAHLVGWLGRGQPCPGCPECRPVPCEGEPAEIRSILATGACHDCGGLVRSLRDARDHASGEACIDENDAHPDRALTFVLFCDGSGYLRPPRNRYAWLTPEAHGGPPDWIRMALIWGSVVRVAAGMGALNLKPVESLGFTNTRCAFFHWAGEDCRWADTDEGDNDYGWTYGTDHGPERGDAAIECLHRLALARGYALIDNTPAGRMMRFEVPE